MTLAYFLVALAVMVYSAPRLADAMAMGEVPDLFERCSGVFFGALVGVVWPISGVVLLLAMRRTPRERQYALEQELFEAQRESMQRAQRIRELERALGIKRSEP